MSRPGWQSSEFAHASGSLGLIYLLATTADIPTSVRLVAIASVALVSATYAVCRTVAKLLDPANAVASLARHAWTYLQSRSSGPSRPSTPTKD